MSSFPNYHPTSVNTTQALYEMQYLPNLNSIALTATYSLQGKWWDILYQKIGFEDELVLIPHILPGSDTKVYFLGSHS